MSNISLWTNDPSVLDMDEWSKSVLATVMLIYDGLKFLVCYTPLAHC